MIVFCEECGTRNYIESALIKSKANEFKCRICGDLIPIPATMYDNSETDRAQFPKNKILIVDDVPNNRLIMEKILEEHCSVILASNGEDALKLAVKEKPDLILLDIIMPGMNGYDVCKKLKESKKTRLIPVVFVTAKDDAVDVKHHIIKQQQIEKKERRYHDRWLRAFDAIGDIVTIQDIERKIVQSNRAACLAVNAKSEELVGKHCYEVFHGGAAPCKRCPSIEMFSDSSLHSFEIHHPKIERTFLVSNTPIYDSTGKWVGWAHTARDTMEKETIESQLQHIRKMELLGTETINILNHFRDILSGILSDSQRIRMQHGNFEGISDNVAKISKAVKQSALLIDGLEKRIKLTRQQKNLQKETIDLSQLLRQFQNFIRTKSGKIINIHIDVPDSLPVNGDEVMLNQIFMIAFNTACETMAKDETLHIEAKRAGNNAWVCMRNTSRNTKKKTTERCSDLLLNTKNYDDYDGLEPSLIDGLVKEMGGKISFESDPNYGAMTTLYFPLTSPVK